MEEYIHPHCWISRLVGALKREANIVDYHGSESDRLFFCLPSLLKKEEIGREEDICSRLNDILFDPSGGKENIISRDKTIIVESETQSVEMAVGVNVLRCRYGILRRGEEYTLAYVYTMGDISIFGEDFSIVFPGKCPKVKRPEERINELVSSVRSKLRMTMAII